MASLRAQLAEQEQLQRVATRARLALLSQFSAIAQIVSKIDSRYPKIRLVGYRHDAKADEIVLSLVTVGNQDSEPFDYPVPLAWLDKGHKEVTEKLTERFKSA